MRDEMTGIPEKVYTVSEITRLIKSILEETFPSVWVEGEISNFHRHHSGHLYFTLKDERCQLRAVMFRSDAARVRFAMEDGLHVLCRGRINVYEPRGEYQLLAEAVEPRGKGALQLAFEQLKKKLKKEGLFSPEKKKTLPLLPKKVGVVTSPRGAAIIDIIRTLERRFGRTHVLIYPVKVQGEGAADEIVRGLDYLGGRTDVDVIIVGRGGGSMEDLWAFNEEKVARAIYRCPIPVISAVGHEVDFTIADFVADIRASTPSAAAEMVIDKEQSFFERIDRLEERLAYSLRMFLQEKKHEVLGLVRHHAFQNFKIRLLNLEQRVDDLDTRAWTSLRNFRQRLSESRGAAALCQEKITGIMKSRIQDARSRWQRLAGALDASSPLGILKKGYTLCWKERGKALVRAVDEVGLSEELKVSFFKGELTCLVKAVDKEMSIHTRFSGKGS